MKNVIIDVSKINRRHLWYYLIAIVPVMCSIFGPSENLV